MLHYTILLFAQISLVRNGIWNALSCIKFAFTIPPFVLPSACKFISNMPQKAAKNKVLPLAVAVESTMELDPEMLRT